MLKPDPVMGADHLHQVYTRAKPDYSGHLTVPVLWDMTRNVMVNNESADILRMFDTAFERLVPSDLRLYPTDLAAEIDALNPVIYDKLNNGVYKAGFAGSQEAYDEAVAGVFDTLDMLEDRLTGDYLFGDRLTEINLMPGVLVANMVFEHAEAPDETPKERKEPPCHST